MVSVQIMYLVTWCALFSTVHRYMTVTDYWLLCLGISLITILITIVIIVVLHRGNNEASIILWSLSIWEQGVQNGISVSMSRRAEWSRCRPELTVCLFGQKGINLYVCPLR